MKSPPLWIELRSFKKRLCEEFESLDQPSALCHVWTPHFSLLEDEVIKHTLGSKKSPSPNN
jgi:hypothetical protein